MKLKLNLEGGYLTVTREPGDVPPFKESLLLHRIKLALTKQTGRDWIKKRMWKDGHMVSDHCQYLRERKPHSAGQLAVWDSSYAVRDIAEDFRECGEVVLSVANLAL